jgi:hypothetical protein
MRWIDQIRIKLLLNFQEFENNEKNGDVVLTPFD